MFKNKEKHEIDNVFEKIYCESDADMDNNTTSTDAYKWSEETTHLLIQLIQINFVRLNTGVKKAVFQDIAREINATYKTHLTFEQIDSKWKGLKRTYGKIKECRNNKRGSKKNWEFFHALDEILCASSENNPLDTVQSYNYCDTNISNAQNDDILEDSETNETMKVVQHKNAVETPSSTVDNSEIYGRVWAAEFKELNVTQKILAKRLIDEILYQGRFGQLTPQTVSQMQSECKNFKF